MSRTGHVEESPRKHDRSELSIGAAADLLQRRIQFTENMANHTVKTDSVMEFLDGFLPLNNDIPERPHIPNPFATLKNADKKLEIDVQDLFMQAVTTHKLSPGFVMCRSEARPDPLDLDTSRQKVDAAFFHTKDAPTDGRPHWVDQCLPCEFKNRKRGNELDPFDDREDSNIESSALLRKKSRGQIISYADLLFALQQRTFLFMLLIIGRRFRLLRWDRSGVVTTKSTDYFKHPDLLCDFLWRFSHSSSTALGFDPTAIRLPLRPNLTNEMDDIAIELEKVAVDHTNRPLDEALPDGFVFTYVLELFKNSIAIKEWPRHQLSITDDNGDKHHYLVGKPTFRASGAVGRTTKGYVAYDVQAKRLVWLKDTWRAWYEDIEREGDVLLRLNKAGVSNVPTVICHGDVGVQITETAAWWERKNLPPVPLFSESAPSASSHHDTTASKSKSPSTNNDPPLRLSPNTDKKRKREHLASDDVPRGHADPTCPAPPRCRADCSMRHHRHYRVAIEEVCLELKKYVEAQQLVTVVLECIIAHMGAATSEDFDVNVLHRDIVDSNIMIYPRVRVREDGGLALVWTGMLIDWDLSKPIMGPNERSLARQPICTANWQFTSVNLLMNSRQPVRSCDDLESFLLILVYYAMRYLPSDVTDDCEVALFIDETFDCFGVNKQRIVAGRRKLALVVGLGQLTYISPLTGTVVPISFSNPPLDWLISSLLTWFKGYYEAKKLAGASRKLNNCAGTPTPPPRKITKHSHPSNAPKGDTACQDDPQSADLSQNPDSEHEDPEDVLEKKTPNHWDMLTYFTEALGRPDWNSWQQAVPDRVLSSGYSSKHTLVHVVLPEGVAPGSQALSTKWLG